ncbi:serine/threonine-protein kinase [Geodermatophilus poikilotrophus]|uniref:non-specific serine/threonine protein kinase n=1 Tax=Geodermatophilus poikilotrophus TaxID=1333667 RepID=A0A1I0GN18_9ACTN|nr:serine/threonine-protein kinase [Geodermatophilus poikilotrophus]SET72313.1 serine/threonine protein kinase [Geodermatophilus poikilotrophus]
MALSTGTILAGRYEITAPIATGGMGEVWRARDRVLDRVVAAKVLRSEFTGDPSFVARFRNEARHTAALSHPNIASVYDYGETEDERGSQLAFLVMELVEGKPLVTILHEEGKLPVDWTLHVLGQSADGLSAAHHAGVVHRDIKPGNLIVRPDGVVKLTDFGIARARDATPLTRTGMVVGTAQYLSPEQAQGFEVTAASDVYSLGVVGYECLTGGRPFDGTSQVAVALAHINRPPPPLPANVPPAVRQLIERALAKDPADRFADGAAFAAAIRSVASGNGLPAAAPGTTPPLPVGAAPTAQTEVVDDLADSRTQVLGAASAGGTATGARTSVGAMPPLRRTEDDDEDDRYAAPLTRDDGRRRNRWLWLVAGLVLLALLGGGLWALLRPDGADSPAADAAPSTSAPAASAPSAPGTVFVDSTGYVGDPVDDVEQLLTDQGLRVTTEEASAAQLAELGQALDEGDVVTTDPFNANVAPDSAVTLYYAPADYAPGTGDGGTGDQDQVPADPTTAAPTRTTAAAPSTSSGQGDQDGGNGQGNGRGNGQGDRQDTDPGTDTGGGSGTDEDGATTPEPTLPGSTPTATVPGGPTDPPAGNAQGQQMAGESGPAA